MFTPFALSGYGAPPTRWGRPRRIGFWCVFVGIDGVCSCCPPPLCGGGDPTPPQGAGPVDLALTCLACGLEAVSLVIIHSVLGRNME